ncbi:hypothetical protein [uncultured Lacinutrix sp.]|uniref:hypothetical protein n=1 Tax=uncultured Lacinutrix sp. TaxID=574032 RepID=UPI0026068CB3|nr:hypothetical protein [uncultured Lacinutrix sp.]
MENKKAIKLIDNILKNLETTGINTDALIEDIKKLRTYVIEEEIPLAVKVLRYTYEHIEENNSFLIPIPEDNPIDEDSELDNTTTDTDPVESLKYLISLIKNLDNELNILDLKDYKEALLAY